MANTKLCVKCLKKKSILKFKTKANGRPHSYCLDCEIGYYREYNASRYISPESRDAELKRAKVHYQATLRPARMQRKIELIMLMGGKCDRCGYNKSAAALDFHHRPGYVKTRTISHLLAVNQTWAWIAALTEAEKCEILCSNCHREETFPGWELEALTTPVGVVSS